MSKARLIPIASILFTSAFAFAAQETSTARSNPPIPPPQDRPAVLFSDSEIVAIYHAVNQADINAAKLAQKKVSFLSTNVNEMAAQTEKDHKNLDQALDDIEKRSRITPKQSDRQKQILIESQNQLNDLEKVQGDQFAKAYLQHEAAFHTKAIALFSKELIPNAKDPKLKELLEKGLTALQMHFHKAGTLLNLKEEKKTGI